MKLSQATSWVVTVVVMIVIVLGAMGVILEYWTNVERRVYERSYQRVEALKDKASTLRAAIVEIEHKLRTTSDPEERRELEARLRALMVQLAATEERLEEVGR